MFIGHGQWYWNWYWNETFKFTLTLTWSSTRPHLWWALLRLVFFFIKQNYLFPASFLPCCWQAASSRLHGGKAGCQWTAGHTSPPGHHQLERGKDKWLSEWKQRRLTCLMRAKTGKWLMKRLKSIDGMKARTTKWLDKGQNNWLSEFKEKRLKQRQGTGEMKAKTLEWLVGIKERWFNF